MKEKTSEIFLNLLIVFLFCFLFIPVLSHAASFGPFTPPDKIGFVSNANCVGGDGNAPFYVSLFVNDAYYETISYLDDGSTAFACGGNPTSYFGNITTTGIGDTDTIKTIVFDATCGYACLSGYTTYTEAYDAIIGVYFLDTETIDPPLYVLGCTNPTASNYDPDATVDDGTCEIGSGSTTPITVLSASDTMFSIMSLTALYAILLTTIFSMSLFVINLISKRKY